MKPSRFKYIAPDCPEAVVATLVEYDGDSRCLSGGQSLIPLMNFRLVAPAALIDLNRCPDLAYIRYEGSEIAVGAMARQAGVEFSDVVAQACPLIAKAMPFLGSPAIRNRGTIGGTLAHADRTAELPAVSIALGATMIAFGPDGARPIAAEDFFIGDLTTSLEPFEMLREVRFPVSPAGSRCAFVEATNRHHDLALAGIALLLVPSDDGVIQSTSIVCHGIGPHPVRLAAAEAALVNTRGEAEALRHAASLANEGLEPEDDNQASADYRSRVVPGLVARALNDAMAGSGAVGSV